MGDRVVIRDVLNGQVWTVRPVTILEDSDAQVVSCARLYFGE
jgi:hypothetical protein